MYIDFKCEECEHVWMYTKQMKHHQFPKRAVPCPYCGGTNTRRVWGDFTFTMSKDGTGACKSFNRNTKNNKK